jgi:hypothetical protein
MPRPKKIRADNVAVERAPQIEVFSEEYATGVANLDIDDIFPPSPVAETKNPDDMPVEPATSQDDTVKPVNRIRSIVRAVQCWRVILTEGGVKEFPTTMSQTEVVARVNEN